MLQNVRGTKDITPPQIRNWHYLEQIFRDVSSLFSYEELRTPVFEYTEVFSRGVGDSTDIVNKEMYTFLDKSDNSLTLRPEMTAALVRSAIQNNLIHSGNNRLWYAGPFFRYERPQAGRQRQFHQFGAECLNASTPESDVEVILLANAIIEKIGIKNHKLLINSLGTIESRERYKDELKKYFKVHFEKLSEDSQRRLEINPLRILDSKAEQDIAISNNAPQLSEYFDEESKAHFDFVINALNSLEIDYEINQKLVRGLDYYSHTVFEFQSSNLGSQDSFGGGGRYNGLFEQLGGKSTPAVGFAFGIERLLMIAEKQGVLPNIENKLDYYIICPSESAKLLAMKLSKELTAKGKSVLYDLNRRSFKSQMKEANNCNAEFAIILGEDELSRNSFTLKNMKTSEQSEVKIEEFNK